MKDITLEEHILVILKAYLFDNYKCIPIYFKVFNIMKFLTLVITIQLNR